MWFAYVHVLLPAILSQYIDQLTSYVPTFSLFLLYVSSWHEFQNKPIDSA